MANSAADAWICGADQTTLAEFGQSGSTLSSGQGCRLRSNLSSSVRKLGFRTSTYIPFTPLDLVWISVANSSFLRAPETVEGAVYVCEAMAFRKTSPHFQSISRIMAREAFFSLKLSDSTVTLALAACEERAAALSVPV